MIPVDQIQYSVSRDHSAKGPAFKCVASLAQPVADGAVPVSVSVEAVAADKDAARDAAQKALLAKLIGAAAKAAASPPPAAKPKE